MPQLSIIAQRELSTHSDVEETQLEDVQKYILPVILWRQSFESWDHFNTKLWPKSTSLKDGNSIRISLLCQEQTQFF